MSKEYNFGKEVRKSLNMVAPNERRELLAMIFKSYVAKLLELLMSNSKNKNALEAAMLDEVKNNLISEFRNAPLEMDQISEKMYEDLFDTAIKEILNEAALNHEGVDKAEVDRYRQFSINPSAYIHEGGLIIPEHLRR